MNDADKPEETISFVLDPVSTEFKIDASGQIKVKTATNFNHEKTAAYTVTVKATDDGSPAASAEQEVVLNIADVDEAPLSYANASPSAASTDTEITLSWNNNEYEAQFDEADRASIVVSYGSGTAIRGTMTAAIDDTEVTLTGLSANTAYTITLRWYSADGLFGASTETLVGTTEETTVQGLRFDPDTLTASIDENTGYDAFAAGNIGDVAVGALGGSGDLAYSRLPGADGDLFSIVTRTGVLLLEEPHHFDHELKGKYTINLRVSDGTDSVDGEFVLTIDDVDESGLPQVPEFATNQATLTVTIPEVFGNGGVPPIGTQLVTATLAAGIPDIVWTLEGRAEDLRLVGISATNLTLASQITEIQVRRAGLITLKAAATLDFEVSPEFMTITAVATTGSGSDRLPLVIRLSDIEDETPGYSFTSAEYESDGAVAVFRFDGSACDGSYLVEIAEIADLTADGRRGAIGTSLSCLAFLFPQSSDTPSGVHTSKDRDTNDLVVRITLSSFPGFEERPLTVRVHNAVNDSGTIFSTGVYAQGVLEPPVDDGISADSSSLAVTRSSRTDTVAVKLLSQPAGNQNVTVTMVSGNPDHLAVLPDHLVFTPANWETTQNLTVSLTDNGLMVKSDRSVKVELTVHDASNSASNYQDVEAVPVQVAVNLANVAPTFDRDQRSRNIDENTGSATTAAGTPIGTPIVAEDEDNDDAVDLMYSINPASSLFGIGESTGQLTVSADTNFDYEVTKSYTVTVEVHDNELEAIRGKATVTVSIGINPVDESPVFSRSQPDRVALVGVARTLTLRAASDPEDDEGDITYSIPSKPDWIEQSGRVLEINADSADRGLHTITLVATDTGTNTANQALKLDVIPEPSLTSWKLQGGTVVLEIASEACASYKRFGKNEGIYGFVYNSQGHLLFPTAVCTGEDRAAPGISDFNVKFEDDRRVYERTSAVGPGRHTYEILYDFSDSGFFSVYRRTFNLTYDLSAVTITVAEVPGTGAVPAGHKLGTVTLDTAVASAQWSLMGSLPVNVSAVAGAETTEGALALAIDAPLNFEGSLGRAGPMTVTVEAATPDTEPNLVQALVEVVLTIANVNEPPAFASEFPNQQVSGIDGGTFTFHAATDPDVGDVLTYSASIDGNDFPHSGVSFDPASRVFTVASGSATGTFVISVVVEDAGDLTANQDFELRIADDGINADYSALAELNKDSRTDTVAVKLISQPAGSQNVTVTMVSGNPTHLAALPAHLVFTPANWQTAQNLTVSLTDAGLMVKGSRSIDVNLTVHDAGNSASNYQGVSAVSVPVAVNVANGAPEFAAGERSKTHEENNGAVGTNVGTPVAATDEDNDDAVDLMYSVNPASSRFGIDAGTGQLTVKTATDFNHEVKDAYTVTVEVHDNEAEAIRGKATVTVAIGITDVNEAPEFDSGAIVLELQENDGKTNTTAQGDPVGDPVVANDEDGDNISYALEPVVAEFEVDASSGQIKVKAARHFNHEKTAAYTVTVKATDDDTSPASGTKEVVINITDEDEAPGNYANASPSADSTDTEITVSWNNNEYEAQFEEPDRASIVVSYGSGAAIRGTMTAAIDDTAVTLTGLSANTAYTITLRWYSKDGLFGDSTETLVETTELATEEVTDHVPVFVAPSLLATVDENSSGSVGTVVGTVVATDGNNDPITYSIVTVTVADAAGFGIGSDSGIITISAPQTFDYESKDKYTINVSASDGTGGVVDGQFVLTIANIDEPPVFSGSQPDRVVLVGVPWEFTPPAAIDPEGAVTYSIMNKPAWIDISRTDRHITVSADASARGLHTITIVATDTGSNTANLPFTLDVIPEPSLTSWKLQGGRIVLEIASEACASYRRRGERDQGIAGMQTSYQVLTIPYVFAIWIEVGEMGIMPISGFITRGTR